MLQDISIFLEAVVICEQSNNFNSSSSLSSPGILFINIHKNGRFFWKFLKISLRTKRKQSSLISEIGVPCSQKNKKKKTPQLWRGQLHTYSNTFALRFPLRAKRMHFPWERNVRNLLNFRDRCSLPSKKKKKKKTAALKGVEDLLDNIYWNTFAHHLHWEQKHSPEDSIFFNSRSASLWSRAIGRPLFVLARSAFSSAFKTFLSAAAIFHEIFGLTLGMFSIICDFFVFLYLLQGINCEVSHSRYSFGKWIWRSNKCYKKQNDDSFHLWECVHERKLMYTH